MDMVRVTGALLVAVFMTANAFAEEGCELHGKHYPLGHVLAIDKEHPRTKERHRTFEQTHGISPDGGAYKYASCEMVIDPVARDYPTREQARYAWVSLHQRIGQYPISYDEKE